MLNLYYVYCLFVFVIVEEFKSEEVKIDDVKVEEVKVEESELKIE